MKVLAAALMALCVSRAAGAQAEPKDGRAVLARMHDAYAGKWYRTLTFAQTTTVWRANGGQTTSTWYESLRYTPDQGTQLRIDVGNPSAGNGMLYSADSSGVLRAGTLASARAGGNEFLPLIEGVYMQPVEKTAAELASTKIDLSRVARRQWNGRDVWMVGATSAADSVTPQFWVDVERNVVVRMILSPAPGAPPMDIHLDEYVPLAGGWLATKVSMSVGGQPRQLEEYSDWKANVDLAPGLFAPAAWTSAPHWVKRP